MEMVIRQVQSRPLIVPMKRPLQTSTGTVNQVPLVLIDLVTDQGITGRSYVFGVSTFALKALHDLVQSLGEMIRGDAVAPHDIEQKLRRRTTLLGPYYLLGMALSGIDMACWDAVALSAQLPLVRVLGGIPRPIPAYNSNGLGIMPAEAAASEALQLIEKGFRAIKIRLGRERAEDDLAAVRAVRQQIPGDILLMSDFNQSLSVAEAVRRCRMLDGEGLFWIEEPVRADDFSGCARVSEEIRTPIQIGENFYSSQQMQTALTAHASDFVMPDLQRIGGVSGWIRASALAHAAGVEMSSHLFPEISASMLAVTPTAHWLEYVDWANPILQEPFVVRNGQVLIPDRPGNGLMWDESAVQKLLA
jgi:mandelate racemase